jgi:hypothetical protein
MMEFLKTFSLSLRYALRLTSGVNSSTALLLSQMDTPSSTPNDDIPRSEKLRAFIQVVTDMMLCSPVAPVRDPVRATWISSGASFVLDCTPLVGQIKGKFAKHQHHFTL